MIRKCDSQDKMYSLSLWGPIQLRPHSGSALVAVIACKPSLLGGLSQVLMLPGADLRVDQRRAEVFFLFVLEHSSRHPKKILLSI